MNTGRIIEKKYFRSIFYFGPIQYSVRIIQKGTITNWISCLTSNNLLNQVCHMENFNGKNSVHEARAVKHVLAISKVFFS